MAIFNSSNKIRKVKIPASIITEHTKITGEIDLDTSLHIDGEVIGKIYSKDNVIIGKKGNVRGEIKAEKVIVAGEFEGKIFCNVLEILESGKVIGEISVIDFILEKGGIFEGNSYS